MSSEATSRRQIKRRHFMQGAGAALAAFTILKPNLVRGVEANSKIRIGLIGCGGRGKWIAGLFQQNGSYEIAAGADYFEDRVNAFGDQFKVAPDRRFSGLSCYKRMIEKGGLDAVMIISPPIFHPEQAAAGVEAGLHVYLAKPIAVDVPGCMTIEESGKKATAKKLCFLVDFQTRANDFYREAVKRAQFGDIGKLLSGEAAYQTGRLGAQDKPGTPEARLKNWVFEKTLSGDIITEQNIHALDVASWILDDAPVKATGTGGRKVRTDVGDCWDHFSVIYTFPKDFILTFSSKQAGAGWDDILCRIYGAKGTIDTHYGGSVSIIGETPYKGGNTGDIYQAGAVRNIADFAENIRKGNFENATVAPSVRSNLTTILGRTAAYTRKEVTWDEMMKANEKIDGKLEGLKD
ncbi:MAG TPA: Gfo/Idh/MocA family oxidoreductase [Candidatus Sumerlaeota bacterium]|nr:Gfo/Idh/MocA family oxidoreductase [Candidatus Sumerlaeota bacterium]HPS01258.1 Gfo/Idh/MocA family oxidoreductase [Candidatus Sumerlaeota bacterium]